MNLYRVSFEFKWDEEDRHEDVYIVAPSFDHVLLKMHDNPIPEEKVQSVNLVQKDVLVIGDVKLPTLHISFLDKPSPEDYMGVPYVQRDK